MEIFKNSQLYRGTTSEPEENRTTNWTLVTIWGWDQKTLAELHVLKSFVCDQPVHARSARTCGTRARRFNHCEFIDYQEVKSLTTRKEIYRNCNADDKGIGQHPKFKRDVSGGKLAQRLMKKL
eukprot:2227825-Amphidinium_carterae.1